MFNQKKYEELLYKYMNDYSWKNLTTIFKLQILEKEKRLFLEGEEIV
jgi:hypothetical protein